MQYQSPVNPDQDHDTAPIPYVTHTNRSNEVEYGDSRMWLVGTGILLLLGIALFAAYMPWRIPDTVFWLCLSALLVLLLLDVALIAVRVMRGSVSQAYQKALQSLPKVIPAPPRLKRIMADDEELLLQMREHPLALSYWDALAVILTAIALVGIPMIPADARAGRWILFGLWAAYMLFFGGKIILWLRTTIFVTTKQLCVFKGVLRIESDSMPLDKFTSKKYVEPRLSVILTFLRIVKLHYGFFDPETAGANQSIQDLKYVPKIEVLFRVIDNRGKPAAPSEL